MTKQKSEKQLNKIFVAYKGSSPDTGGFDVKTVLMLDDDGIENLKRDLKLKHRTQDLTITVMRDMGKGEDPAVDKRVFKKQDEINSGK